MHSIRFGWLLLVLSGSVMPSSSPNIDKFFSDADFLPHIPSEAAIETVYGKGKVVLNSGIKSVYYSIGADRQMQISYSDGDSASTAYATDVTICRCKLANDTPNSIATVSTDSLLSVHLGDSLDVLEKNDYRYVVRAEQIGRETFTVYETNPVMGETDLYIRYLICADHVVGFSVGVTE